jgi:ssDNA-binding Zn-finger/Zn-ribbon topoisomerase 1
LKCPLCGKPLRQRKQKDGSLLIYCEGKDCKYRIEVEVEPSNRKEEEEEPQEERSLVEELYDIEYGYNYYYE